MAELPILSGAEIIKVLQRFGYRVVRQRGSHVRLLCVGKRAVTVPQYRTVSRGLLMKILRDAEITPDAFLKF